jgi:4-diphosphocytidyl-2-C-methyl-D-erythritol kinase
VLQAEITSDSSSLTVKAPAKINLFLKVLNRRSDGYHDIESAMLKIALFDRLHFSRQGKNISLTCPGSKVPTGPENLVYRAAEAFFSATGKTPGIRIVLEKNIPVAAGLGGGSSDAAATLNGLNRFLGADLKLNQLLDIGLGLGADVPFFVHHYSSALATGIGECLQEIEPLSDSWIVLVNPGFPLSTKWAYENFPLTSKSNQYIFARVQNGSGNSQVVSPGMIEELGNDLETVSVSRYPEIEDIKKELKKNGAAAALMSGSGPTVFGLFHNKDKAQNSFELFVRQYGSNVFLVKPYIP